MPKRKTCGNCANFVRVKRFSKERSGVCLILDNNCHIDTSECKKYRGKRYARRRK